jgi:hypothetical protein
MEFPEFHRAGVRRHRLVRRGRLSALSMLLAIFLPSRYRLWSALFAAYSVGVVLLTV